DPVFDVAFWATFHPDRRHGAFLDGYRSVRDLPADFERRFRLYYPRVALSKTVLRHRLGLADRPGRPPASLRIQRALERLEALPGHPGTHAAHGPPGQGVARRQLLLDGRPAGRPLRRRAARRSGPARLARP